MCDVRKANVMIAVAAKLVVAGDKVLGTHGYHQEHIASGRER